MLTQIFKAKGVEYFAEKGLNDTKNIKDFEYTLKTLQKNLKSLSAKAADVEEEIKNAEVSGRKKRKREVKEWLEEVECIRQEVVELGSQVESEGFIMRLMDGGKTVQLNEQVAKLVEQSRSFGKLVLDVRGNKGEKFLTNGMVGEAFNENLEIILNLLEARRVSSIGIWGMGGIGKTTLAKHVHNRLLQQYAGRVFWVTVSQEFTISEFAGQDSLSFRCVDLSDEDNEDKRAARLHRALSKMKNSIFMLDDVWEKIDLLKVGCLISAEGCRLIITTRSLEVCRQIRCQKAIRVEKLGEDEVWDLFHETLGNEIELGPRVQEIEKSMAKLCGGLPLGIITVAGSMRGETAIHAWRNALEELKERVVGQDGTGGNDVFEVLKYSFDRLNRTRNQSNEFSRFQLSFLHCSLYPEDCRMRRDHLVLEFISAGLVDERKSRRAQVDQGYSVLDKLVNVCLLESCGGGWVKMHDLVRAMALKIGEGKYMVRAGDMSLKEIPNEEEWTEDLEKVSLMECDIRRIGEGISPDCPDLSTLLLRWNKIKVIPDSFFSRMQGMCFLDLSELKITMLPDSICDMTSLEVLLLERCKKLEKVPNLGQLKALRELNLSKTAIKEVPRGVEELLNLKLLSLDAPRLEMVPRGLLQKLTHLQHVEFPVHMKAPLEEIENLKQLEEFRGGAGGVKDFNSFIRNRMHDACYRIQVGPYQGYLERSQLIWRSYDIELVLSKCNLKDEIVLGQCAMYLGIRTCEGLSKCFVDDLPQFNNPTSLKKLIISGCGGIECILSSEQGLPASKFSNTIQNIELDELEGLKAVLHKEEMGSSASGAPAQRVFPSLIEVIIRQCSKMRKLGLPLLGVPKLLSVSIWMCPETEEIFEGEGRCSVTSVTLPKLALLRLRLSRLPRLQKVGLSVSMLPDLERISILGCDKIEEIFEDEGRESVKLPNLKVVSLTDLPRVKTLSKAKMICNSIETINILGCPRLLKKLPVHLDVPPPPSLREIQVEREWWESLKWRMPIFHISSNPSFVSRSDQACQVVTTIVEQSKNVHGMHSF